MRTLTAGVVNNHWELVLTLCSGPQATKGLGAPGTFSLSSPCRGQSDLWVLWDSVGAIRGS